MLFRSTEKIIYIMEYLDPTELGIKAKFEMKNNIIGMAMNDTYLAYFDLTEPDINVVTISTLKSSTIHKDFDVYSIEIANQNLIALGVNTFITYMQCVNETSLFTIYSNIVLSFIFDKYTANGVILINPPLLSLYTARARALTFSGSASGSDLKSHKAFLTVIPISKVM